ncbi:MAG TPA: Ig-like domain-containing protein, partial [Anaeromyxobacteraceae bacterium]|nr:Ig-like domain-containing protein [Anaeromyxobacteraceae bacterium]
MLRVHHALALSATILAACGKSAPADTTPPAAPLLAATLPASPSSNAAPHLTGTAEPLATVKIFGSAACAGAPLATGIATAAGAFDVAVSVTANTTTQLAATATDAAGNVSPCSAAVPYVHDSLPPASPAVATAPASPSSNASPHVTGTAEAGSTVSVYASAACAGAPLASGVASAAGAFDVAVSVTPNVTTQLAATATDAAGNVSGCSTPVTYVHDDRPQTAPAVATAPASPSSNAAPHVTGTAEAASTVTIYGSATCAGAPLATGAASAAGAFDLAVTVATNATTQLAATATDAAGNVSPCSAAVAYLHDDRPPAAPALVATRPASPSPSLTPTVDGTAEASALVRLYAGTGCAGPELSQGYADAAGAFHVQVTVASNVTTSLSATAADAAGNVSACSAVLAYTHDDVAPAPPIVAGSTPASPANQNAPTIQVQAEPGASVSLYADALCATTAQGTGTADASGQVSIGVAVADNTTTTFHAQATDAAGNVSGCSATSVTYVEESRTFTVSPASVELDPGTSPLSSQAFTYALTGGPDAGVTWAVEEAGGGTVDAAGTYQAPVQTGTYHVAATTTGPLPALVARATVVVRSPVIRGSIAYAGASAGRIYVSVGGNFGGAAIGGTSIAVPGPGTYAYTVRGIVATGAVRVSAWFDAAGMVRLVPAADPYGEVTANLTGSSLSGVDVALTAPAAVAPVAPTLNAVFPADATAVVVFDGARDSNGREIADGYDVSCTTGTPPAAPGPGAVHVPAGADHVALVRGLSNGATYVCSAWADNHGVQSAPAVSAPLTLATPAGFTVSGTITLAGGPVAGPAYVVLLDQTTRQARITRYAAPTFPLAYSV